MKGGKALLAFVVAFLALAGAAFAAPSINLNQSLGSVGDNITISGSGFNSTDNVTASTTFNGSSITTQPNSTNMTTSGNFYTNLTFLVPNLPSGTYDVNITTDCYYNASAANSVCYTTNGNYTNKISTNFTINPMINLSASEDYVGENVTVYGWGFVAGEQGINVSFDGTVKATVNASSNGYFSSIITIPDITGGTKWFNATGPNSSVETSFTVLPKITLNDSSVAPGDNVTIIGTGFISEVKMTFGNEALNSLNPTWVYDNTTMQSVPLDVVDGNFTYNYTLPDLPSNIPYAARTINVTSETSNETTRVVTVTPKVSVTPSQGTIGTTLFVAGVGFAYGETINSAKFGSTSVEISGGPQTVNELGNVLIKINASAGYGEGEQNISVTGASSNTVTTRTGDGFTIMPKLNLSSPNGTVGSSITVYGWGFNTSEANLNITFGGLTVKTNVDVSNTDGTFSASITVPEGPGGNYTINVTRDANQTSAVTTDTFKTLPKIVASASSAPANNNIQVNGTGFVIGELVNITIGGVVKNQSIAVDANGSFSANVNVTTKPGSTYYYLLDAVGTTTPAASVDDLTFIYSTADSSSAIELNTTFGYVADVVKFYAHGLSSSGSVKLKFDSDATELFSGTSDANGAVSGTITIPDGVSGNHSIYWYGHATVAINFTVSPKTTLNVTSGYVADAIKISGAGFEAGEQVGTIRFDSQQPTIINSSEVVDSSGRFSMLAFIVPDAEYGSHSVNVTGNESGLVSTTFQLNSSISLNASSGNVGDEVRILGTGFKQSVGIEILFNTTSVYTGTPDMTSGKLNITFTIPDETQGSKNVTVQQGGRNTTTTLTLNPRFVYNVSSAEALDIITINGTGCPQGDVYPDSIEIGSVAGEHEPFSIGSDGKFTGLTFTIPTVAGGNQSFGIKSVAVDNPILITSAIKLSKTSGYVGDSVTISGTGFRSGEPVQLTKFGGSSISGDSTTAKSDGTLTSNITFTVPNAQKGEKSVTLTGGTSGDVSTTSGNGFTINPTLTTINPIEAKAGETIDISGTGFTDPEVLANGIKLGGLGTSSLITVSDGAFTYYGFEIPSGLTQGLLNFTVQSENITERYIYSVNGTGRGISLNASSARVGDHLMVYGTGFNASEVNILLSVAGENLTSGAFVSLDHPIGSVGSDGKVDATTLGAFMVEFIVPSVASSAGTKVCAVNCGDIYASITITPSISLSATSGSVNDSITVTGTGFAVNESGINVTFAGAVVNTTNASESGAFSAIFKVPELVGNSYDVDTQGTSNPSAVSFEINPNISFSTTTAKVGSVVYLSGTGFQDSTIAADSVQIAGVNSNSWAVTPENGSFINLSASVPDVVGGYQTVTLQGNDFDDSFNVGNAEISLSASSGYVGDSITVTGTNFVVGETVTVTFDGVSKGTDTADSNGDISVQFTIPSAAYGAHTIDAYGTETGAEIVRDRTFSVSSKIAITGGSVTATSGYVGDTITVTCTGLDASASGVTATFGSTSVTLSSTTTDAEGDLSATFDVPAGTNDSVRGSKTVTLTQGSHTPTATFTIKPKISVTPTSGVKDATVTVTGSGFGASETPIKIYFGGSALTSLANTNTYSDDSLAAGTTITANSKGQFEVTFTVPDVTTGGKNVYADAAEDSNTVSFTVSSSTTDDTGDGGTTTTTCSADSDCASTEKCVSGTCTFFSCTDGYYQNHVCVKYVYSYELAITGDDSLDINQGNSSEVTFTLKNEGNGSVTSITVTVSGANESWYSVTSPSSTLSAGATTTFKISLDLPDDAWPGDYDITITAEGSQSGSKKTFIFTLGVIPDETHQALINASIPELEDDVSDIVREIKDLENKLGANNTNYTALNSSAASIQQLYEEAVAALERGDYKAAFTKYNAIRELLNATRTAVDEQKALISAGLTGTILRIVKWALILGAIGFVAYLFMPPPSALERFRPKQTWRDRLAHVLGKVKGVAERRPAKREAEPPAYRPAPARYQYRGHKEQLLMDFKHHIDAVRKKLKGGRKE